MGAGCYYTNNETKTKAFWIDIPTVEEDEDNFTHQIMLEDVQYTLEIIGYEKIDQYTYVNGLYKIVLESTYYGGGIVIRMEPLAEHLYYPDEQRLYNLAMANHGKCYKYLAKELIKSGYDLRIASSGYTSMEYNLN